MDCWHHVLPSHGKSLIHFGELGERYCNLADIGTERCGGTTCIHICYSYRTGGIQDKWDFETNRIRDLPRLCANHRIPDFPTHLQAEHNRLSLHSSPSHSPRHSSDYWLGAWLLLADSAFAVGLPGVQLTFFPGLCNVSLLTIY